LDEQCDAPKSRIGRFRIVSFLAATSVIAGVRRLGSADLWGETDGD
jgi:hypothetical protein